MPFPDTSSPDRIPIAAGIGLRFPHHREVAAAPRGLAWVEVHPENYMAGGAMLDRLDIIRRDLPVSLHGVGLSLGSAAGVDSDHVARLKAMIDRVEPGLVSDHLSWSVAGGVYLPDLLPLPYTEEALRITARNIDDVQSSIGRTLLIENPSRYLAFHHTTMTEAEFLSALVARTGCRLLYDINNLFVSARNLGEDPAATLFAVPIDAVAEIHLAGHTCKTLEDGAEVRIDDHGSTVASEVWDLYARFIRRAGPRPTLIEWDREIPALDLLKAEAAKAQRLLDTAHVQETLVA
ncbi:MAG: DUF692 domain-containing protein [Alphaproteobacteria bacterium]|nr:DUF692 domain-containing protein [Alphaproteobacteria bacterium]